MAVRLVVQTLAFCAFMGVLLFGGAGTLNWPQAWAFLALFGVLGLGVGFWLLARDPGLLAERLGSPSSGSRGTQSPSAAIDHAPTLSSR